MRACSWIAAAALVAASVGCSDDGGSAGGDAPGAPAFSARLVTYNAGLATNFVDYAPEREPLVEAALAASDADVLCVQEVWDLDTAKAIAAGFEHHYLFETKEEVDPEDLPACDEAGSQPLLDCAVAHDCESAPSLSDCVLGNCGAEFEALEPDCTTCLAANISKTLPEIIETCRGAATKLSFGGHNGLLLLSRLPLDETDVVVLDSSLVQRVALFARIGPLSVACTHLAAVLDEQVDYNGEFGSYQGEQAHQIEQLQAWLRDKADGGATVLMGDMNTGPAVGDVAAEVPESWQLLVDAGWRDVYLEQPAPPCTWCADNPLASAPSSIIDHILVKNAEASDPRRVFDEPVTLDSAAMGPVDTRLSDHYGVEVTVTVDSGAP